MASPRVTLLDRAISYFSPQRGLARTQARAVMSTMLAYDGARVDRRTGGWSTGSSSANAEIGMAHEALRERARDLDRNNPHATKGVSVLVSNKIGTGIMAQAKGRNLRFNRRLDDAWNRWVDECDLERRLDLYGIQALAERTRVVSGEALIRLHPTVPRGESDIPLRLQVLEPDYLDSSKQAKLGDNHWISYGVEYIDSVPVAYWLFDEHPGDSLTYSKRGEQSRRVSAAEVMHYFKPLRPGQTRGVTDLAPVMLRLRALAEYDDAEVMRKRIAACLAAFVTSPGGLPGVSVGPTALNADGDRIESFRPGMVSYLKPGEGVQVSDPRPSTDYEPFNRVQLRAVAAGLNMPYELLTGDLSGVNYTSHRGGLVQFRGMIEADQWQVVVPQLCRPIWQAFISSYRVMNGAIDPETQAEFTPPRFGLLDPSKEIKATVEAIQSGIESFPNAVKRDGYDWRQKIDEAAEALEYAKEKGMEGLLSFPQPKPAPAAPPPPSDDDVDEVEDEEEAAA